jgi:glycosyltransferase involved in cell wall biosynthesis
MLNNKIVITNNSSKYIFRFKKNLVSSLLTSGYSVTVIAPWDEYSSRLSELGVDYKPIEMDTNGLNPLKDLIYICRLAIIYKSLQPYANLLFTIKPNIYGTLVSQFFGIKTINNITGLGSNFLQKGILQFFIKILYRFSFKFSSKAFFQNDEDKDLFINQKLIKEKKTQLIPGSGVDLEYFKPVKKVDNKSFIFLMIGRVIRDKGVLEYIKASKLLLCKYDNIKIWLLGDCDSDSLSSISLATVSRWQSSGIIEYFGEVEDVRDYISQSDVVVLPSYREGMPRVLLEASAMERPIIGSDVPGCRHIVKDESNGYLCNVKDHINLFKKMEKMILLTSKEREEMGKKGRLEVENNFDEKIVIRAYLDSLKELSNKSINAF